MHRVDDLGGKPDYREYMEIFFTELLQPFAIFKLSTASCLTLMLAVELIFVSFGVSLKGDDEAVV